MLVQTEIDQLITGSQPALAGVYPPLADKGRVLIYGLAKIDMSFGVFMGLRTFAQQNALYAQGRITPGKIVTKAKGGQSWHNFGL